MKSRVVATGMGVLSPMGNSIREFWENAISKTICYDLHKKPELFHGEGRIYGEIAPIEDALQGLDREQAQRLGRPSVLALHAAKQALRQSGIDLKREDGERISVIIGNAISDTPYCERVFLGKEDHAHRFEKGMFVCIASNLAKILGSCGEVYVMSTGCTAGIDAIGAAFESIRSNVADVAVCGGVEAPISNVTFASFEKIGALAKGFESMPQAASRPFDRDRNGFVLSEGCGILVLESLSHALQRGAQIIGEILAYDSCSNAFHMTDLKEEDDGLARAITQILREAGISPSDIDYINAHGSSTRQNDIYETATFKRVFGEHAGEIAISTAKSQMGHPLGSASAIEIIQTLLAIQNATIPPIVNYESVDEKCDLHYVTEATESRIRYAVKTANGFSGIHSAMLLGKYS